MKDGVKIVHQPLDRACAGCRLPFADPDLVVLVFEKEEKPDEEHRGAYHLPCYEDADVGAHRSVIALVYGGTEPPAELARQVDSFVDYVYASAVGIAAEELDDEEIAARWPLVDEFMARQRTLRRGNQN